MAGFFDFFGNLLRGNGLRAAYPRVCPEKAAAAAPHKTRWKIGARCAMMKANPKKEQ